MAVLILITLYPFGEYCLRRYWIGFVTKIISDGFLEFLIIACTFERIGLMLYIHAVYISYIILITEFWL